MIYLALLALIFLIVYGMGRVNHHTEPRLVTAGAALGITCCTAGFCLFLFAFLAPTIRILTGSY